MVALVKAVEADIARGIEPAGVISICLFSADYKIQWLKAEYECDHHGVRRGSLEIQFLGFARRNGLLNEAQ